MFAIPAIIVKGNEDFEFFEGVFYRLPPEVFNRSTIINVIRRRKDGWWTDESGFSFFSKSTGQEIFIFPFLRVRGKKLHSKFAKHIPEIEKDSIESYYKAITDYIVDTQNKYQDELNILVHDLRGISTTIYNSALEAKRLLEINNYEQSLAKIDSVIASQAMLKIRTDLLDYVGNPASIIGIENIPIYKRTHKVVRIFSSKAFSKGVTLRIAGESYNVCVGPDIFEIIPYIIIDNAIKYSCKGLDVIVNINDIGDETCLTISSYGPNIDEEERFKIFSKQYRAVGALEALKPGSGIGLSIARRLIEEHFDGVITVDQYKDDSKIDQSSGLTLFRTEFTVLLPSHREVNYTT